MIIVNDPGDWDNTFPPLLHADWHGITLTDFVFPFFIFIVGVSGLSYALNSLFQLLVNAKIEGSEFISNYQIHDVIVKQLLDFMHYFKLNKFHLNITDDERFLKKIKVLLHQILLSFSDQSKYFL